jgi:hypothetical protein
VRCALGGRAWGAIATHSSRRSLDLEYLERVRFGIQAIVVAMAIDATAAAAQPIWIVPRSDADQEVVRYLDAALPEATVRWDWTLRSSESLLVSSTGESVLIVDSRAGKLEASRHGEPRPFERVFDFALARTDPYAVAVVAAELLALPELPAPPTPEVLAAVATNASSNPPDRNGSGRTAAERTNPSDRAERTERTERATEENAENEEAAETSDAAGEPSEPAGPWAVSFSLGAALAWAPSSDVLLVRPTAGVEIAWQTFALELGAAPFGISSASIGTPEAELDYTRHSFHARLSAGVRVAPFLFALGAGLAIDVVDVGVTAPNGNTLSSADRIAAVPFAELEARVALGAGFGVQLRAGAGIDPSARLYLANGAAVFEESEVFLRTSLALSWGFSP